MHVAVVLVLLHHTRALQGPIVADLVLTPLHEAYQGMDRDGVPGVSFAELSVGILSSAEPWDGAIARLPPAEHAFGESQCQDPTLDALSFIECAVHNSRASLARGIDPQTAISFEDTFDAYIAGCSNATTAWLQGICLGSCRSCAALPPSGSPSTDRSVVTKARSDNQTTILISSDWHIEPWYLSKPGLLQCTFHGICRFDGANASNMFECRDASGKASSCTLDGHQDPPIEMEESHLASEAGASAQVHFFIGDVQPHEFTGNWSLPEVITIMLAKVLGAEVRRFGAGNVVWAAGNNDGPHDDIFKSQDEATVAWADSLLRHNIVTDDLGIVYDGVNNQTINQTALFKLTGFYTKALAMISPSAFAIVLNTNLGGNNTVQTAALLSSLQWIQSRHGAAAIVYLLGHHPSVMKVGVDYVPASFQPLIKGVFAGHVHYARATTAKLFTQVPAVTQAALNTAFFVVNVSTSAPEIRVELPYMYSYAFNSGKLPDASAWRQPA